MIPTTEQARKVAAIARGNGIPYHATKVTLNAAANVATEAKDISNTPMEKPKVAPMAIIVVIDMERRMVMIFDQLKKAFGAVNEKIINATAIEKTIPQFIKNRPA
jgi:hypothetical protein